MAPEIEMIFHAVSDLPREARGRYFEENHVAPAICREVESLLNFDAGATGFLAQGLLDSASQNLERAERGSLCGAYRLMRVLGSGGMGTVYLAERADGEVTHRAAIKLLRYSGADSFRLERFLRERQILASINHPNIARLLDAGHRANGEPYLVMEYVEGERVDEYASRLPVRDKLRLMIQICEAVSYAHRNLIVHRDLKPSNIMVDSAGRPKLLDFGIAKTLDEATDRTQTVLRMLTPLYSSPEQFTARPPTTVTDVYSLGAVLYKLLTGRSPHEFPDSTPDQLITDIQTREPVRPSKLVPKLGRDLDVILGKALRKEPEERYRTVDGFAEDLQAFLEGRSISIRRRDWIYRVWKFRGPIIAAAWAVAVLSLWYQVRNPRTKALHGSDVMSLIGCGMCFGMAFAYFFRIIRKGPFK